MLSAPKSKGTRVGPKSEKAFLELQTHHVSMIRQVTFDLPPQNPFQIISPLAGGVQMPLGLGREDREYSP